MKNTCFSIVTNKKSSCSLPPRPTGPLLHLPIVDPLYKPCAAMYAATGGGRRSGLGGESLHSAARTLVEERSAQDESSGALAIVTTCTWEEQEERREDASSPERGTTATSILPTQMDEHKRCHLDTSYRQMFRDPTHTDTTYWRHTESGMRRGTAHTCR